jgi:hypothetical protein
MAVKSNKTQAFSVLAASAMMSIIAGTSQAQQWSMNLNSATPGGSTMTGTVTGSVGFSGNLRGNWVSTTNPTGTRTLLGFFGGGSTTNDNVPISGTATSNGTIAGRPSGQLIVRFHEPSRRVWISRMWVDSIGAANDPTFAANSSLTYSTFRTVNPNYLYPSLGPINVPVGEAVLTQLDFLQQETFTTIATAGPNGTYTFSGQVPFVVRGTFVVAGTSSFIESSNTSTVSGTITPGAEGQPGALTLGFSNNATQVLPPVAADPANPIPFALPAPSTATPPPPPANVLLVVGVTGGNVALNTTLSYVAAGARSSLADVGSEGGAAGPDRILDNNDFVVFIDAFFSSSALADVGSEGGAAIGDSLFDNNDFVVFINAFFGG